MCARPRALLITTILCRYALISGQHSHKAIETIMKSDDHYYYILNKHGEEGIQNLEKRNCCVLNALLAGDKVVMEISQNSNLYEEDLTYHSRFYEKLQSARLKWMDMERPIKELRRGHTQNAAWTVMTFSYHKEIPVSHFLNYCRLSTQCSTLS